MFIATAYAMGAPGGEAGAQGGGASGLIMMAVIFAIFYFILIRPQQKKMKEHKKMVDELKKGDEIVVGGIYDTVENASPGSDTLTVKIADGVKVKVIRGSVAHVITEGHEKPKE